MTNAEKWALQEADELLPEYRELFDEMIADGQTPQFAMMCIHQKASNIGGGDSAFGRSAMRRMNGMRPDDQERIVAIARKAGVQTEGKYYCGQLGKYDNPLAWCSTADDLKKSCQIQNFGCDGVVKNKRVDTGPTQGPKLAKDIVNREVDRKLSKDAKLREQLETGNRKISDVREQVVAKHGKTRKVYEGAK